MFNYDGSGSWLLNAAYWYNPFGKQDSVVVYGTGGHLLTYNDKELDEELNFGMYYYGARFYDPVVGRFSSPDPIKDYLNPYSYVRNNPIRFIDPTGMLSSGIDPRPAPGNRPLAGGTYNDDEFFGEMQAADLQESAWAAQDNYDDAMDEAAKQREEEEKKRNQESGGGNSSDNGAEGVPDPNAVPPEDGGDSGSDDGTGGDTEGDNPDHPYGPPGPEDDKNGNGKWDVDEDKSKSSPHESPNVDNNKILAGVMIMQAGEGWDWAAIELKRRGGGNPWAALAFAICEFMSLLHLVAGTYLILDGSGMRIW